MNADVEARVTQIYRDEWARIVGGLTRRCGDLDLAEEMAAEAFAAASELWPENGVPPNPAGWITTTAYRRAIDRLRRESFRDAKQREALMLHDPEPAEPTGVIDDDRLRLLFTCCHPVLSLEARVALTLRIVGGLTVEEIARAFLIQESAVRQRITRAKAKIKTERIPYRMPAADDLRIRVDGVLAVLYLIFNEGHAASSGPDWMRPELSLEAIRLTRVLAALMPRERDVHSLLALMELTAARFPARVDAHGEPVLLADPDRRRWDRSRIGRGRAALAAADALGSGRGPYGLQAAIAESHAVAPSIDETDWDRIVLLYEALGRIAPSPVVELNRAAAVAMATGPASALQIIDALAASGALAGYHLLPATRGELLVRLGRADEARSEFAVAAALAGNDRERALLQAKATER
ncbi:sigma-70 family RNA polymerase sigma factor [Microbacterium sp. ISL-103]|uniref:RNA polymerase sigma factor n=1 Tax=Microbacterium sp. ISL-103 TaxID=2819156 RepID=UPI00288A2BBF|nr:sigma-70 family RNA polymerase sigma factor [Microbacterium sp. ISL-103]